MRNNYQNWPTQLRSAGDVGTLLDFVRGGATATSMLGTAAVTT